MFKALHVKRSVDEKHRKDPFKPNTEKMEMFLNENHGRGVVLKSFSDELI